MKVVSTKGIVLNRIKYSESSIIVNILTEEQGKVSFLVNGVRNKKAKIPAAYFQAFNVVHLEYSTSLKSDLCRIIEISTVHPMQDIFFDVHKTSLALFLAEVVNAAYPGLEKAEMFFPFLESLILYMDASPVSHLKNIHLWTLVKLMYFMGINPIDDFSETNIYFNPIEAHFTSEKYENAHIYQVRESALLHQFLNSDIHDNQEVTIQKNEKRNLLELILEYYQIHFEGFRKNKSLSVILEVFE